MIDPRPAARWPYANPQVHCARWRRPMQIALYYAPITCALAPYITLIEAGATFEVRPLNFRKNQHNSPEYLKINPKHKVPLLVVDGKVPQAKLLPSDPWQELQAMSIMSWCSGGIHPFLARINSPVKVCDVPGTEDSVKTIAKANLMELFKIADDMLAGREFFFDHFTAPDAHFFWCQRRARQFEVDFSGFKHCSAHFDRMLQRPSVQKVVAFEKSVQEEFAKAA
jgi:glutathione S-transferase